MQSYQCTSSLSTGLPINYFFSLSPDVVVVLADAETIMPPGATSIATAMDNSFATASLPASTSKSAAATPTGFSSVILAPTKTYTMACPSDIHSLVAERNSARIAAIILGIVLAVTFLVLGVCCYPRHRKPRKISSASHPSSSWPSNRSDSYEELADNTSHRSISERSCPVEASGPVPTWSISFDGRPSLSTGNTRSA